MSAEGLRLTRNTDSADVRRVFQQTSLRIFQRRQEPLQGQEIRKWTHNTHYPGSELGRHHIPPYNVSCLHKTPTLGTHQDRLGLIPSCLHYLYEDNLFIGIQRVKLFKYPELGQYSLLALVLTLVLRHSMFVDINLTAQLFIIRNSLGSHQTCPFEFRHLLYVDTKRYYLNTRSMCRSHRLQGPGSTRSQTCYVKETGRPRQILRTVRIIHLAQKSDTSPLGRTALILPLPRSDTRNATGLLLTTSFRVYMMYVGGYLSYISDYIRSYH